MFGVTTPCVEAARKILEARDYEVLVFHATGTGGRTMESFISDGMIAGVLDITTTELADELVGGTLTAGRDRLTAAGLRGVPQVISLGALFMVGLTLDFNATINQTLIMLNADKALYGRVMSVYMMTWALSGFSASLSGVMMDHVGGAVTMLSQGSVLAVFVVLMATMNRGYKLIRNSIGAESE